MNIFKVFYVFNFLLVINLFISCYCNDLSYLNLNHEEEINMIEDIKKKIEEKRKKKRIILYSSLFAVSAIALIISSIVGASIYKNRKKGIDELDIKMDEITFRTVDKVRNEIAMAIESGVTDIDIAAPHRLTVRKYILDIAKERGYQFPRGHMNELLNNAEFIISLAKELYR